MINHINISLYIIRLKTATTKQVQCCKKYSYRVLQWAVLEVSLRFLLWTAEPSHVLLLLHALTVLHEARESRAASPQRR